MRRRKLSFGIRPHRANIPSRSDILISFRFEISEYKCLLIGLIGTMKLDITGAQTIISKSKCRFEFGT